MEKKQMNFNEYLLFCKVSSQIHNEWEALYLALDFWQLKWLSLYPGMR